MADAYTLKQLKEVEDSAPNFGLGEFQEARFAKDAVNAEHTGFTYLRVKPDTRSPFGHKHENAEEVYVVIGGSGRAKLDDELVELERLDALRVSPSVVRGFEAGPDGLELLAFGPRHDGDGEVLQDWWSD